MISCVAKETIFKGGECELRPGTLKLVRSSPDSLSNSFVAGRDINEGEAVSVVPLDEHTLIPQGLGVVVAGTRSSHE